jgi:cell division protein FtsB
MKERQRQIETELADLRMQREQREAYLRLVLSDPEFLERVVRERLGMVKPDETVFRFDGRR